METRNKPESRTFTALEYQDAYGTAASPGPIEQLATVVYTNRPLLFLGCSLKSDRTVESLKVVHKQNPFLVHYAVLAAPLRVANLEVRARELAEVGIHALWYVPRCFEQIAEMVDQLVAQIAFTAVLLPTPVRTSPSMRPPKRLSEAPPAPPGDDWQLGPTLDALLTDRLVFFLGAGVHPDRLTGTEFYEELCRMAGVPWPSRDRADVAQHITDLRVDRGRHELNENVKYLIETHYGEPRRVHEVVAALPSRLSKHCKEPLLVLTTNYDCALELALERAGEAYQLFIYRPEGAHAGQFLLRNPDGSERAIVVPAAVEEVTTARIVVVKLNGGLDPLGHWVPPSFAVASQDFEELSTRLPAVLPQVVWDRLRRSSLLFWGHGLREPDVRSLVRHMRKDPSRGGIASWAIRLKPSDLEFWKHAMGIEVLDVELSHYLDAFEAELATRVAPAVSGAL